MAHIFECHSVLVGLDQFAWVFDDDRRLSLLRKVRVTAVLLLNVFISNHVRTKARSLTARSDQLLLIASEPFIVRAVSANKTLDLADVNESWMDLTRDSAAVLRAPDA